MYTMQIVKNVRVVIFLLVMGVSSSLIFAKDANPAVFSIQELQKLGITTIEESIDVMSQVAKKNRSGDVRTQIFYQGVDLTKQSNTDSKEMLPQLELNNIDHIEISKDGAQIKYHLSKTLTKDNLTALFSFTVLDLSKLPSKLNPRLQSATKYPEKSRNIGDTIGVIRAEDIETLGITSIDDALGLLSNVSLSNSSGVKSLFMRGFHSGATKILFNGIDLKDVMGVNGAPLFELIPIEDVDRIEFISGSKSTIHGSGALAGVINVISKTDSDSYINTRVASNHHRSVIKNSARFGDTDVYILGSQQNDKTLSVKSDNDEIDAYDKQSLSLGFSNNSFIGKWSGSYTYINQKQDLDDAFNDDLDFDTNLANVGVEFDFNEQLSTSITWSHSHIERLFTKDGAESMSYEGNLNKYDITNLFMLDDNKTLIVGVDSEFEYGLNTYFNKTSQDKYGIYTQFNWINSIVSTQLGGRLDKASIYGDRFVHNYNASLFNTIPIIDAKATLTYKTGFRLPTLYEYANSETGLQLDPEVAETKELSLSKLWGKAVLSVTYFESDLTDKISYNYQTWKYNNITQSNQMGYEYNVSVRDLGFLNFLTASYTTLIAQDNYESALRVPENKLTLSTGMKFGPFRYGLYYINESEKPDVNSTTIPQYDYMDIAIHYELDNATRLYTKIHNVFDEDYQTVSGFNELGRTFYFGINRQFD